MNLVFVSFLHGIALPILFPIALVGVFNNFVVERLLLARYYKQPPLFDNRLNDRGLGALLYAPLFMLANGYWVLGNRQMFFNQHDAKEHSFGEIYDPKHYLFDFVDGPNHLAPLLICIPIIFANDFLMQYVVRFM